MPLEPETPPSSAIPSAPVSDTADVASQGPTDSTTDTPVVPEPAPEAPVPTETVASPIAATPEPVVAPTSAPVVVKRNDVREYLVMALEKITGKKTKRLAKIMAYVEANGTVTNDQVEKLIRCSHASATRYLSELEKQGKITQDGKIGRGVTYRKA